MSFLRTTAMLLCLGFFAASAHAYTTVSFSRPWALATKPGQKNGAAYMELEASEAAVVTKLESPQAKAVEVHSMTEDKGVMKMRKLDRLDLPARTSVKLQPGGLHLMLIGLKKPMKAGDTVVVKMTIVGADKKETTMQVDVSVRETAPAN